LRTDSPHEPNAKHHRAGAANPQVQTELRCAGFGACASSAATGVASSSDTFLGLPQPPARSTQRCSSL